MSFTSSSNDTPAISLRKIVDNTSGGTVGGESITTSPQNLTAEQTGTVKTNLKLAYDDATLSVYGTLVAGRVSIPVTILSDSTDTNVNAWGTLLAQSLAAKFPAYSFRNMFWDSVNDAWLDAATISTGSNGFRYLESTGGDQTAQVPNAIVPTITGDFTFEIQVFLSNWIPASQISLGNKMGDSGNFGFRFQINTGGGLQFNWSNDGNALSTVSSPATGFANNTWNWVKLTFDVDNGSSGSTAIFYTSQDGVNWTQLGTPQVTAGVTSIFNTTAPWEIFGWLNSVENWAGRVGCVRAKSGIDGQNKLPQDIEYWFSDTNENDSIISLAGSPTLTMMNGGYSGATIDTWDDPTRIAKALIWPYTSLVVVSLGHNEGSHGSYFTGRLDTLLAAIRTRCPNAGVLMISQNPRISPAGYIWQFDTRRAELQGWCRKNGCQWVDVYRAFFDDGRPLSSLIMGDGIHPTETEGGGQQVWADAMESSLFN